MSEPIIREVATTDKASLKAFVTLDRKLIGSNPRFVSEIDADVTKALSGRSAFFSEMDHALFAVSVDGVDVARCSALINHRYQRSCHEAVGFIGHFAASPGSERAVATMIERAESWLRGRGVSRVVAPCNGSAVLGLGLLTAAFDEDPMFPFFWHPPYYDGLFVGLGYARTYPFWYYTVDFTSEKYAALKQRAAGNQAVHVRPVNKKEWKRDLESYRVLMNAAFQDEWEFQPMTPEEFEEFFDPIKPVIDPHQMLIGEIDGEPAGFCMGFPDWTPLFRSFHGKMGLLQIMKFMFRASRYQRAGLLAIGVLPAYKGNGLAQAMAAKLYGRYEEKGLKEAFYYPVNEENLRSRGFAESIGGTGRVLYHAYDKRLT